MNIFLLEEDDFIDSREVVLKDRRYYHAKDILKLRKDGSVKVGMVGGKLGIGKVISCGDNCLKMHVEFHEDPLLKHDVILILALPRPPVFKRILAAAASLGFREMMVIQTARVEKSYWNSPALNPESIRHHLILGLEQAKDTVLPHISFHQRFRPFIEDHLAKNIKGRKCFFAHPEPAQECPYNISDPMMLAVGPEGGFVDFEVEKFRELGFEAVHLGKRILRVETAVQAFMGRLMPL